MGHAGPVPTHHLPLIGRKFSDAQGRQSVTGGIPILLSRQGVRCVAWDGYLSQWSGRQRAVLVACAHEFAHVGRAFARVRCAIAGRRRACSNLASSVCLGRVAEEDSTRRFRRRRGPCGCRLELRQWSRGRCLIIFVESRGASDRRVRKALFYRPLRGGLDSLRASAGVSGPSSGWGLVSPSGGGGPCMSFAECVRFERRWAWFPRKVGILKMKRARRAALVQAIGRVGSGRQRRSGS